MKVRFRPSDYLEFELEGSTQKELFKKLAEIGEIFADEPCGECGGDVVRFVVRTVEDNDYFEKKCEKCGAKLAYGQNKTGGSLFPKRKKEVDGEEVFDREKRGWHKWVPTGEAKAKGKRK